MTEIVPRPLLDREMLAALAHEVAMDINELWIVLERFKLTEAQYEEIRQNRSYQRMLEAAKAAWNSGANATERIKIEAARTFEHLLPIISKRLESASESLDDVVKGARMVADVAGLGIQGHGTGERVTINIDLGSDKLTLSHEIKPIEAVTTEPPRLLKSEG